MDTTSSNHRSDQPRPTTIAGPDPVPLSIRWGAVWGLALGMWFVAPAILNTHFIYPRTVGHWLTVFGALVAFFALTGASLTILASPVLVIAERVRRFSDRAWAYAVATGPLLVAAHVVYALVIQRASFKTFRSLPSVPASLGMIGLWLLAAGTLFWIYRRCAGNAGPAARKLAVALAITATTGSAALPLRTLDAPPRAPRLGPLTASAARGDARPLLLIGIDGATWRVLEPLMAAGETPHLQRLASGGIRGETDALWPPYWSGAAWSAILTGLPRETTGVYEDLAGSAPGLPPFQIPLSPNLLLNPFYTARRGLMEAGLIQFTPPPRGALNGQPFWELLHGAGVSTAVVRFRFTYPASGQADIVVSDWIGHDQWKAMGIERNQVSDAVAAGALTRELVSIFEGKSPAADLVKRLLPESDPNVDTDARNAELSLLVAADIDARTFDASELILRKNPRYPLLALYVDGLDSIEHAFWQYRFPEDFDQPPASANVKRLGPVIDRYVRHLDERLGRLLATYVVEPNVLIVSDHGHGASTVDSPWPSWHTGRGIFLLAGPDVPHSPASPLVSYYDILPTVLDLKHFETPPALRGSSVLQPEQWTTTRPGNPIVWRQANSLPPAR